MSDTIARIRKIDSKLDHAKVLERLSYDPNSGQLVWIAQSRFGCCIKPGQIAGSDKGNGYRQISIMGEKHNAHRLIWFIYYGKWPEHDIDHINGLRSDNRISNLRDVPRRVNLQNRRRPGSNAGNKLLGVTKKGGKWLAQIRANDKWYNLGRWGTEAEAHEAYVCAKRRLHEGCVI